VPEASAMAAAAASVFILNVIAVAPLVIVDYTPRYSWSIAVFACSSEAGNDSAILPCSIT
jgi:hypothetical protein